MSSSEKLLGEILDRFHFNYMFQKRYDDCRDNHKLPFDFYLNDFNILIEFDGEDHYFPIQRGNKTVEDAEIDFIKRKVKDEIKTKYCKQNNIPLIRIPYWERDNIEYFLWDQLVKYGVIEEINENVS
jgi:hypothetical protein